MKYNKPIITIDKGLAEGVYAASGSIVAYIEVSATTKWGAKQGQRDFKIKFSSKEFKTFAVVFNNPVTNVYGGGGSTTVSGNNAIFVFGNGNPEEFTLSAQVYSSNVEELEISSYSFTN